jgi:hypothetical protein
MPKVAATWRLKQEDPFSLGVQVSLGSTVRPWLLKKKMKGKKERELLALVPRLWWMAH